MKQVKNSRFESHLIENREVRIFLSSTFSDMEAERSALVKRFNKLKLEANRRNVSLSLLDLRWGVTDEEARTGKVLSVCLNEIENSHPFFIGLLGSRYGYAPRMSEIEKNPDLEERYPWIHEDIVQNRSITEIEMQYGVLRDQESVDAAFFIKALPGTLPDDDDKLTSLKTKIRSQQRFPVGDYTSIEDLCDQVEKAVIVLLDKYFSDADDTRLGRERSIQQAYMNSRHKFYIRKQEEFDRLNEFLRNDERHLVVTGASGMGKSALIANWLKEQEKQKECPYNIIYHFVGNTYGGNSHEEILQHLSDEMFDLYDDLEVKLGNNESPEEKAQRYMTEAVQKGKPMLIVIDGINQISERDNAKLLNWLPQSPKNVKYLFSTLKDDATMQTFERREYPVYTVGPLNDKQRSKFVVEYLEKVGKHLDDNQLSRILHDPENENTLVLKTLLDELICFGSYEHLNERIDYYLSATSISDFFDRILHRMEDDYEGVQRLLSLIAVSEHGLSEEELIAMTGIRQMDFHQFYCAISAHIVTRNGLLTFGHQYMTDAVWNRYHLDNIDSAKPCRESIISYFNSNEISDRNRQISELAFQYYQIDDCKNLYKTILSLEAFRMFDATSEETALLASYWRKLLKADPEKYQLRNYLDLPYEGIALEDLPYLEIGRFAIDYMADYHNSLRYSQTYLQKAQLSGKDETSDIAISYNNIGAAYYKLGNYLKAIDYYLKALTINKYDRETATIYNNIGSVYYSQGNYQKAFEYYQRSLNIRERFFGTEHTETAISYSCFGNYYTKTGDYVKALEYYNKALNIRERILGVEHPDVASLYIQIGEIYLEQADFSIALKYYTMALNIRKTILGEKHPDTANTYNSIGGYYSDQGDYSRALTYYFKALSIFEKILGTEHPKTATLYHNIGTIFENQGDYTKAIEYFSKAMGIKEKVLGINHPDTATTYHSLGAVYREKGDYSIALEYHLKALNIRENILGTKHPDTSDSYNSIGCLFSNQKNYSKALDYYHKSLSIREEIYGENHPNTAASYNNIGYIYDCQGIFSMALNYYSKALDIHIKSLGDNHPDTADSYNNIGVLYYSQGNNDRALYFYLKALKIRESVLGPNHPDTATTYISVGLIYNTRGEHSIALDYLQKALVVRKKILGVNHPSTRMLISKIESIQETINKKVNYDPIETKQEFNKIIERLSINDQNEKWGFINQTGKVIIPCQWKNAYPFSEGLACVEDNNGKFGFIDKTGKTVLPFVWYNAASFSEGVAPIMDNEEKWGFINKTGKIVIPCQWPFYTSFKEGVALVKDINGKYGFIDKTGKLIIPCQWKNARQFNGGLACVQDCNGKYGLIDKTGEIIISCHWLNAGELSEGLISVKDDTGLYGFIDRMGKIIIPCQWDDTMGFSEGLTIINIGGKWGFIDKTGNQIIQYLWEDVSSFQEGLAPVRDCNRMWGCIDRSGKVVIPYKWKYVQSFKEGLAKVEDDNNNWGFIDKEGKLVIPCKWKDAQSFNEGLAPVMIEKKKVGIINRLLKIIKP